MEDSTIRQWKSTYSRVYAVELGDIRYYYRSLTIGEYDRIYSASSTTCELEDAVVMEALLYPEVDYEGSPGRLISSIAKCILDSSMLGVDNNEWDIYLEEAKSKLTPKKDGATGSVVIEDPITPLKVQICSTFPAYKISDLDDMCVYQLLDLVACAELAVGNIKTQKDDNGSVPDGLGGAAKQRYLEEVAAEESTKALMEEMRKARGAKSTPRTI